MDVLPTLLENQDSDYTSSCLEWDNESSWTHRNSNGGGLFLLDNIRVSGKVLELLEWFGVASNWAAIIGLLMLSSGLNKKSLVNILPK